MTYETVCVINMYIRNDIFVSLARLGNMNDIGNSYINVTSTSIKNMDKNTKSGKNISS